MVPASRLLLPVLAGSLLLAACTGPDQGEDPAPTPSAVETTSEPRSATVPGVSVTHGAIVADFPEVIEQFPDSTIVQSSFAEPDPEAEAAPSAVPGEEPTAEPVEQQEIPEGMVSASLVMETEEHPDPIIEFYVESLGEAGFEPVGDRSWMGGVLRQTFHEVENGQTVSVSVSGKPGEKGVHLVTVGGVVVP
ncbi:hypothetical protein [Brevibacterium litoralis]|uniref:hypothetical protein n=1 Tax=Brevibacterium litoralis TaxID=3138935 RepID=UPI0032EB8609